jgi:hypothetical protein
MEDGDKPIWQLTIGEFVAILESRLPVGNIESISKNTTDIKYVYGIAGLAKLIGCSKNYAGILKRTGMFDEAISQNGRTIIIDAELALKLFNANQK